MANRWLQRPFCYQRYLTIITGHVILASGGAITSTTGLGYSVVKTSTGLYTFTITDQFYDVAALLGNLVEPTVTTLVGRFKNDYTGIKTASAGTLHFQITDNAASAADVAAAAEIHFQFNLINTSVAR